MELKLKIFSVLAILINSTLETTIEFDDSKPIELYRESKEVWGLPSNESTTKCFKEVLSKKSQPNNEPTPIMTLIEVCCEGYKPYIHDSSKCVPDCKDGCENGFCEAPNVCSCFPYYVSTYTHGCVPTCPISCLNGYCHSNGTCTCNYGYILEQYKKFCIPLCNGDCGPRKYCSSPGICSCQKGYEKNSSGQCKPLCHLKCLRGICVSPGVCSCHQGYTLKDKVCQANCTNCDNGKCVATNICACNLGYTFNVTANKCVPVCKRCGNGICVAPGACECKDGYEKIDGSCKPLCIGGCSKGHCVEPGVCNCKEGYARNLFGKCKRLQCFKLDEIKSECVIKHVG